MVHIMNDVKRLLELQEQVKLLRADIKDKALNSPECSRYVKIDWSAIINDYNYTFAKGPK